MRLCGVKLTHDGGVAVIEDGALVLSIEAEKIGNAERYSAFTDLDQVAGLLAEWDLPVESFDSIVVDGWATDHQNQAWITTRAAGRPARLAVAPYHERGAAGADPLDRHVFDGLPLGGRTRSYTSYPHVAGHLAAAYCTSPFAARGEPSFVLVWDGPILPRLYHVDEHGKGSFVRPVLPLYGGVYAEVAMNTTPYLDARVRDNCYLSVPGKAMAYAALGVVRDDLLDAFAMAYDDLENYSSGQGTHFLQAARRSAKADIPAADMIATFQYFVEQRLVAALAAMIRRSGFRTRNICFAGGCALNIHWNAAIRAAELFDEVWVPPFPNDAGSAIGTACAELLANGISTVDWSVYAGPKLTEPSPRPGWTSRTCSPEDLGLLLHTTGDPVVVLTERAELGPRALGNRSILAAPVSNDMARRLNAVKDREPYRPVAPLCLERRAPEVFSPGTPDRYMLFVHEVRDEWRAKVPAVVHVDGTARLQTVPEDQPWAITRILTAYERASGIPVLCNTSANLNGRGFFPDVASAMDWGRLPRIWSDGVLYERQTR